MTKYIYFFLFIFFLFHLSYEINYGIEISKLKYRAPDYTLKSCQCLEPLSEYWGFQDFQCVKKFKSFRIAATNCINGY